MHYENIKRSSSLDRDKVPENGGLNVGYLLLCKGLLPRHFQAFLSPHGLDFFNDRKQQKLKKIGKSGKNSQKSTQKSGSIARVSLCNRQQVRQLS
jgi:hypothetical protein